MIPIKLRQFMIIIIRIDYFCLFIIQTHFQKIPISKLLISQIENLIVF